MIGLARGTVQLQLYVPEWKTIFEREAALLRSAMGVAAQHIEHVGSTAIEGMPAKPIIDLVVVIGSLDKAGVWIPTLEALGYEERANDTVADRLFFAKGPPSRRTHHLSLAESRSKFYTEKVLFRDYLSSHRQAFDEYVELKQELAQRHPKDRNSYTEGKRGFVEQIIRLAKETAEH
jgi:GrpB-like predicted nucleotidyltransferase (UPF0157 family)